jgi:hypothetical protein
MLTDEPHVDHVGHVRWNDAAQYERERRADAHAARDPQAE